MTPAEALEQVRALAESWRFKGRGLPDDMPDQFDVTADQLAHEVLAILDAVTPDAPVTVETAEELEVLPVGTIVRSEAVRHGRRMVGERIASSADPDALWRIDNTHYYQHSTALAVLDGRATVLTPATPERTEQEREAAVGRAARELAGPASEALTDFNPHDWEDCAACSVSPGPCPYHQGRIDEANLYTEVLDDRR